MYTCRTCGRTLALIQFSKAKACTLGYDLSRCKFCKMAASKREWQKSRGSVKHIYNRVKGRASKKGIPFTLDVNDIEIPEVCPVFGTPFVHGDHAKTASVDRIFPSLGYTKENICVISNRANMLKGDATSEELFRIAEWLSKEEQKRKIN